MGLENSEHIQNILIDPRNSNVVYVTAIGPLWRRAAIAGSTRRPTAAQTWKAVLTISPDTGVTDMVMDPKKPDTLYVAVLQRRRAVGQLIGGGPESGLYKTTERRRELDEAHQGPADVDMGRIGLGINWQNPEHRLRARDGAEGRRRLLPIGRCGRELDADRPEVNDGGGRGAASRRRRPTRRLPAAPIGATAAPAEAPPGGRRRTRRPSVTTTATAAATRLLQRDLRRSRTTRTRSGHPDEPRAQRRRRQDVADGAAARACTSTITRSSATRPTTRHMLIGNDGGVYEIYDDMKTWRHFTNLPLSQFYRISTDNARAVLPRLRRRAGQRLGLRPVADAEPRRHPHERLVQRRRRRRLPGTRRPRGSEHRLRAVAGRRPQRLDLRTGQSVDCIRAAHGAQTLTPSRRAARPRRDEAPAAAAHARAQAPAAERRRRAGRAAGAAAGRRPGVGRWHWDAPFIISPHAARRLYFGGDRVYRSDDRGDTWTPISGDLTRNLDPRRFRSWARSGRPIRSRSTRRRRAQHDHGARRIAAARRADLRRDRRRARAGDRGRRKELAQGRDPIPGVPEYTYVTDVQPSPRDVEHRLRDVQQLAARRLQAVRHARAPIADARGRRSPAICRSDPAPGRSCRIDVNANLLFAGIEFGVYVTVDGGSALGAARRAAFRRRRRATSRSSGVKTISSSARSAAAPTSSTTTRRFAMSRPRACRRGAALPAARRLSFRQARTGGSGVGRSDRRRIRRMARCSPTASDSPLRASRSWC